MPDGHEQFSSNGNDRLLFANAPTETLKLG
jgi:hypothetical protein